MSKSIWKGYVSFGLVSIPVNLVPAAQAHQLKFHMLDARNKARIKYQRINSETEREVPWDQIVKAYEVKKNNYVVIDEKTLHKNPPAEYKSFEINEFVDLNAIDAIYFDKPYYLLPESNNHKSYVLLREALKKTHTVGVGKVIIRTKEYLAVIFSYQHALILNLLRFQEDFKSEKGLDLPNKPLKQYQISAQEIDMAISLVKDMTHTWQPEKYHDKSRDQLVHWLQKEAKVKSKEIPKKSKITKKTDMTDLMSLLKKSMQHKTKRRTARK